MNPLCVEVTDHDVMSRDTSHEWWDFQLITFGIPVRRHLNLSSILTRFQQSKKVRRYSVLLSSYERPLLQR